MYQVVFCPFKPGYKSRAYDFESLEDSYAFVERCAKRAEQLRMHVERQDSSCLVATFWFYSLDNLDEPFGFIDVLYLAEVDSDEED